MSTDVGLGITAGARLLTDGLAQFIPEPQSSAAIWKRALQGVASTLSGAAGLSPEYQDLLQQQIEIQQQMQLVTLESNLEKSRHETQMAAIRNMRVG